MLCAKSRRRIRSDPIYRINTRRPIDKKLTSVQDGFFMPLRLVISICHPLLLVSCNDRRGVAYATTLTQALLQVLASYSMQRFFPIPTS